MSDDVGATVNAWVNVVRRANLDSTTKLVALMAASYANANGTRVFPGTYRLAVQCKVSYSAVQRALRKLRAVGLLEVAKRGNRRAGKADEYRLILAVDLLDRLDVATPEQEAKAIADLQASRLTPKEPIRRQGEHGLGVTGDAPPTRAPLHDVQPPLREVDLSLPLTLRAREAEQDPDIAKLSGRKPSTRGQRVVAEAMAAVAARKAAAKHEPYFNPPEPGAYESWTTAQNITEGGAA